MLRTYLSVHLSEHAMDEDLAAPAPRAEKYLGWLLLMLMRFPVRQR